MGSASFFVFAPEKQEGSQGRQGRRGMVGTGAKPGQKLIKNDAPQANDGMENKTRAKARQSKARRGRNEATATTKIIRNRAASVQQPKKEEEQSQKRETHIERRRTGERILRKIQVKALCSTPARAG